MRPGTLRRRRMRHEQPCRQRGAHLHIGHLPPRERTMERRAVRRMASRVWPDKGHQLPHPRLRGGFAGGGHRRVRTPGLQLHTLVAQQRKRGRLHTGRGAVGRLGRQVRDDRLASVQFRVRPLWRQGQRDLAQEHGDVGAQDHAALPWRQAHHPVGHLERAEHERRQDRGHDGMDKPDGEVDATGGLHTAHLLVDSVGHRGGHQQCHSHRKAAHAREHRAAHGRAQLSRLQLPGRFQPGDRHDVHTPQASGRPPARVHRVHDTRQRLHVCPHAGGLCQVQHQLLCLGAERVRPQLGGEMGPQHLLQLGPHVPQCPLCRLRALQRERASVGEELRLPGRLCRCRAGSGIYRGVVATACLALDAARRKQGTAVRQHRGGHHSREHAQGRPPVQHRGRARGLQGMGRQCLHRQVTPVHPARRSRRGRHDRDTHPAHQ